MSIKIEDIPNFQVQYQDDTERMGGVGTDNWSVERFSARCYNGWHYCLRFSVFENK